MGDKDLRRFWFTCGSSTYEEVWCEPHAEIETLWRITEYGRELRGTIGGYWTYGLSLFDTEIEAAQETLHWINRHKHRFDYDEVRIVRRIEQMQRG